MKTLKKIFFVLSKMRVVKFIATGSIGMTVNLTVYHTNVEYLGMHYLLGSVVATLVSMIVGFLLQKYWTFEERMHSRAPFQFVLYASVALLNIGLNTLMVFLFVEYAGIYYLVAQALAALIVAAWSFVAYREIIFKKNPEHMEPVTSLPPNNTITLFSVVMPAHNEEENLPTVLPPIYDSLLKTSRDFELIVVDNASTDHTRKVLETFKRTLPNLVIVSEPILGYGRAVLAGLSAARGTHLGIIRADNQERPEDLVKMLLLAEKGDKGLYKAIRDHRAHEGLNRLVISFFYNILFKLMFFVHSADINAAPKILTRAFYEKAKLESKDWFIDAEMIIKAEKMGYGVEEVEIVYTPRKKGRSMVKLRHIFEFLKNMIIWRIRLFHELFLEK